MSACVAAEEKSDVVSKPSDMAVSRYGSRRFAIRMRGGEVGGEAERVSRRLRAWARPWLP